MTTLQVTLSDIQKQRLDQLAERDAVSAEESLQVRVDQLLTPPAIEFDRIADRVLEKNAELYRRLA